MDVGAIVGEFSNRRSCCLTLVLPAAVDATTATTSIIANDILAIFLVAMCTDINVPLLLSYLVMQFNVYFLLDISVR